MDYVTPDVHRRAKVTDEHRQEAARLKAIWQKRRPALAEVGLGSQMAFGARFGIGTQAAVGFFLNGHTPLSLKAAMGFADGLGCQISDFSPRLAAELEKIKPHVEGGHAQHPGPIRGGDESVRPTDGHRLYQPEATDSAKLTPGAVAQLLAEAVAALPPSRRRTIASLAGEMIVEEPTSELAEQIDMLASDSKPIPLGQAGPDHRAWRDAVFSMAEHEAPEIRKVLADFLLKVDTALREKAHIHELAEPLAPSTVR